MNFFRTDQILSFDDDAILGADDSFDRPRLAFVFPSNNHDLKFIFRQENRSLFSQKRKKENQDKQFPKREIEFN